MSDWVRRRLGGDDTPIIASGQMPDALKNRRLPYLAADLDETTADLKVLLTTNPTKIAFREIDLEAMDENTRRVLLIDVYKALGIQPLSECET